MVTRLAVLLGVALALCAGLLACNGVLGIDSAMLLVDGSTGSPKANANDAGAAGDAPSDAAVIPDDPLTCANYCKVVSQNCTGDNLEYLPSDSEGGADDPCMTICSTYLMQNPGSYLGYPSSEPTPASGAATLACRLWHAHAAGEMPPSIHCRHAGPLGSEACGDPCAAFCGLDFSYCVDNNPIVPLSTQQQCMPACLGAGAPDASPDGGFFYADTEGDLVDNSGNQINSGNTLNCRLWHLETAIQENMPDPHCWHTLYPSEVPGGGPGGPCGP